MNKKLAHDSRAFASSLRPHPSSLLFIPTFPPSTFYFSSLIPPPSSLLFRCRNLGLKGGVVRVELQGALVGAQRVARAAHFHVAVADAFKAERARELLALASVGDLRPAIVNLLRILEAIHTQVGRA